MGGARERQIRLTRATVSALLITHAKGLDNESLQTLVAETEAVALSPSNLLVIKSNAVMPLPGSFNSPDL